jgi:DNA replication protein DnaC
VRFFAADELVEALYRGLADNTVGRLIHGLLRNELLIVDDLGFTLDGPGRRRAPVPLRLGRLRERSLIVFTNVEFEHWTRFLPDEPLPTPPAGPRCADLTQNAPSDALGAD